MSEIFLDIETTGLSFREGHKIVEIACIETQDATPTNNVFHKLVNPERDMPLEAFNIHGFSAEFLSKKETFPKIADDFIKFIKDKKLIIHNAPFDVGFLNHELKLLKKNEIKKENIIDTLDLARKKYSGVSNSLDALCKRFNIDLSRRTKHNALLDCELLREVYINLLDIKEPRLVFNSDDSKINNINYTSKNINYCKKIISPSKEEQLKHKSFLKNEMKKNYF